MSPRTTKSANEISRVGLTYDRSALGWLSQYVPLVLLSAWALPPTEHDTFERLNLQCASPQHEVHTGTLVNDLLLKNAETMLAGQSISGI